jgi:dTDP-4-amino-4,6-dideoxygalactose transaminase
MIGKYLSTFGIGDALGSTWRRGDGRRQLRECLAVTCGCRHVILFRSARRALHALLQTLGGSGKAVLPAYTCMAVPEAVQRAGWHPVFADIAPGDVNMTHDTLAESLPEDARAVILTHQFGLPPAIEPIVDLCRRRGLFVVEDAAAAIGARYRGQPVGVFGDAALISFHLTKVVGAGRVGALLTNDDNLAEKVNALQPATADSRGGLLDLATACAWWAATRPSAYGALRKARAWLHKDELYEVVQLNGQTHEDGFESCSDYVAGLAACQMATLDSNLSTRRALACIYEEELRGMEGVVVPGVPVGAEPAWMQFPIFVDRKAACYRFLLAHGVDLSWTFRYSCGASYKVRNTPNAERAARTVLGLPTYPGLPAQEARRICEVLRCFSRV